LGEVLTTPHGKTWLFFRKHEHYPQPGLIFWCDLSKEKGAEDLILWNVSSLCNAGSLTAAARELSSYKLDLLRVHEVRWDRECTVRTGNYNLSMEKEMKIINWE